MRTGPLVAPSQCVHIRFPGYRTDAVRPLAWSAVSTFRPTPSSPAAVVDSAATTAPRSKPLYWVRVLSRVRRHLDHGPTPHLWVVYHVCAKPTPPPPDRWRLGGRAPSTPHRAALSCWRRRNRAQANGDELPEGDTDYFSFRAS